MQYIQILSKDISFAVSIVDFQPSGCNSSGSTSATQIHNESTSQMSQRSRS